MARIKITGYLEVEDSEFDGSHESGLTAEGYDNLIGNGDVAPPSLSSLEDLETEPA